MVKQPVRLGPDYVRHRVERESVTKSPPSHARARTHVPAPPGGSTNPPPAGVYAGAREGGPGAPGLEHLLALAGNLTSAQRRELLDQLALQNQLAAKAAANPDLGMWAEAVRTALEGLIGYGAGESYGVMLLKRLLGPSACWRPVEQFMSASGLAALRRPERLAVYHVLARFLVEECERTCRFTGAPMSAKFVASQTGNVGGLFERNFPGYIAAGLAPMVARQMRSAPSAYSCPIQTTEGTNHG